MQPRVRHSAALFSPWPRINLVLDFEYTARPWELVRDDYIPDLVQIVTGHDLYELSVGWAAGRCREVGPEVVADGAAAVCFAVGEPGQLVSLAGLEPLRSSPSILRAEPLKAVGETVASLAGGASWDRVADVISRGATAAELALAGAARIRAVSLPSLQRDQRL